MWSVCGWVIKADEAEVNFLQQLLANLSNKLKNVTTAPFKVGQKNLNKNLAIMLRH